MKQTLSRIQPGLYYIQQRNFGNLLDKSRVLPLVDYSKISASGNMLWDNVIKSEIGLNLRDPEILQVKPEDIEISEKDQYGCILLISDEQVIVRYGEYGIAPSETKTAIDLLQHTLEIEPRTSGVLNIRKHVPFRIEALVPSKTVAMAMTKLFQFPDHDIYFQNLSRNTHRAVMYCCLTNNYSQLLPLVFWHLTDFCLPLFFRLRSFLSSLLLNERSIEQHERDGF